MMKIMNGKNSTLSNITFRFSQRVYVEISSKTIELQLTNLGICYVNNSIYIWSPSNLYLIDKHCFHF